MDIHRLFQLRRYLTKLQDSNKKWIHAIIWCIIPEPKVFPNKYCITFIRTIQMILVKDYLVLLAEQRNLVCQRIRDLSQEQNLNIELI